MERILSQTSHLELYTRAIDLGPDDQALPIVTRKSDHSPHPQWCEIVGVAVHRRHGTWTHVYACLLTPQARPVVHLVRVLEGERIDEAVEWVMAQSTRPGALFVRPPKRRQASSGHEAEIVIPSRDSERQAPSPIGIRELHAAGHDRREPLTLKPDPTSARASVRRSSRSNENDSFERAHLRTGSR
jgi:hypothetical protein